MEDCGNKESVYEICVVIPKREVVEEGGSDDEYDAIKALIHELKNVGLMVDCTAGLTEEFIKLAAPGETIGKAAASLRITKRTWIVDELTIPGALALDIIEQAEVEVERLDHLKFSRMKEIAFKKQVELEEIYALAHIETDSDAAREKILALVDSGNVEPSELIAGMDRQIVRAKEEALSRKDILDRVEKWMSACEEERWLEDYNWDDNRYNSSRGVHFNLKRAEKARILVNKIPVMVDTLVSKTRAWEEDYGIPFTYEGKQQCEWNSKKAS